MFTKVARLGKIILKERLLRATCESHDQARNILQASAIPNTIILCQKRPDPFRKEIVEIPATETGSQESVGEATRDTSQLGPQRRQGNNDPKDHGKSGRMQSKYM